MSAALPDSQQNAFDNLYQGAMNKDRSRVRSALTDDFIFAGPIMSFDNPDAFVESMTAIDAVVTESRIIADDQDIAHLFILDVSAPFQARVPMCDVIRFRGDRISRIQLYTDSKLFGPAVA